MEMLPDNDVRKITAVPWLLASISHRNDAIGMNAAPALRFDAMEKTKSKTKKRRLQKETAFFVRS
jgi:hypothetical protein